MSVTIVEVIIESPIINCSLSQCHILTLNPHVNTKHTNISLQNITSFLISIIKSYLRGELISFFEQQVFVPVELNKSFSPREEDCERGTEREQ